MPNEKLEFLVDHSCNELEIAHVRSQDFYALHQFAVIILLTVGPNTHGSSQLDNIIPIGRELVLVVPRGLSEQRLLELIIERCGFFGQVTNIRLMPALPDGRLVFVEMGNTKQSNQVSRAMGGTVFGYRTTAIRLAYFGQRSPSDVEKISPVLIAQATKR